jgi:hypothetical protein
MGLASAAAFPTWEQPSVSVRWRPSLAMAMVTHLVTRWLPEHVGTDAWRAVLSRTIYVIVRPARNLRCTLVLDCEEQTVHGGT